MRPTVLLVLSTLPWLMGAAPERAPGEEPCLSDPVEVVRAYAHPPESAELRLTHCDGEPNREALDALSVLARPGDVDRPGEGEIERFAKTAPPARRERLVARGIRRLHPGLLSRLQKLAERFEGRSLEIVSGHRPNARRTSRHRHARALDLRVDGVHRRKVSRWAREHLEDSGVGFYPNSVFTHIDVRHREAYWVDRSAPGEPADYGPWPPSDEEQDRVRETVLAEADRALRRLGVEGHEEPEPADGVEAGAEAEPATASETVAAGEPATAADAKIEGQTATATAADATTAPEADASSAPGSAPAPGSPPTSAYATAPMDDGECEPGAVGGLCGATGVTAAWSSVPADEDAGDASDEPDQSDRQSRARPGADSPEARRIQDAALAAVDALDD